MYFGKKKNIISDYEQYNGSRDADDNMDDYEPNLPNASSTDTDNEEDSLMGFSADNPDDSAIAPDPDFESISVSYPRPDGRPSSEEILNFCSRSNQSDYKKSRKPAAGSDPSGSGSKEEEKTAYNYPMEYIRKLIRLYSSGTEKDKEFVRQEFCAMLTPLVKSQITRKRGRGSEFQDYVQFCYYYICKRLPSYDPAQSPPFVYFKYVIIEAISNYYEESTGISGYYSNIDRKVRKLTREYAASHIRITPSKIAQEIGATVSQIEDSFARIAGSKLVYEGDMSTYDFRNYSSRTPEKVLLQQESEELLYSAIATLPEDEQIAICFSYGLNETRTPTSNKAIAGMLGVSESKVKSLLSVAKRRLRKDYSLDQLRGNSKRLSARNSGVNDGDPARYSFDPASDEYVFLDVDTHCDEGECEGSVSLTIEDIRSISFADFE